MKQLLKQLEKEIENEHTAYEMGCLISAEFTPAPTYEGVYELIKGKEDQLIKYMKDNDYENGYIHYIEMEIAYARRCEPDQQDGKRCNSNFLPNI